MNLTPSLSLRTAASPRLGLAIAAAIASTLVASPASAEILDSSLPNYRPVNDLSGNLSLMGSTTMTNVASVWIDSFQRFYPDVQKKLEIRGSRGAVPAVMAGEATFGLLSRKVYESEIKAFTEKFGYAPKVVPVCLEQMAIYTHPENPIRSLTLLQLQSILAGKAKTWSDVGVEGAWASQPIRVHGRRGDTGSRVYLEQALRLGESHKPSVEHASNGDLVEAVAADKLGIGYAGLIYSNSTIKDVPIATNKDSQPVKVDSLAAAQGQYPLARPLQLVVNQKPGEKLTPAATEFVNYVLSRTGQEDVIRAGFQPIRGRTAEIARETLNGEVVR